MSSDMGRFESPAKLVGRDGQPLKVVPADGEPIGHYPLPVPADAVHPVVIEALGLMHEALVHTRRLVEVAGARANYNPPEADPLVRLEVLLQGLEYGVGRVEPAGQEPEGPAKPVAPPTPIGRKIGHKS